jgi:hypothetical protein
MLVNKFVCRGRFYLCIKSGAARAWPTLLLIFVKI